MAVTHPAAGQMANFMYLVGDAETRKALIVDPAWDVDSLIRIAREDGYEITRSGAYWIHRLQNEYSLNYINRLWGGCRKTAWPNRVML